MAVAFQVLGGLFMRGYAYQESSPVAGITIFPELTSLEPPQYLQVQGQLFTQASLPLPELLS